ncbi:MAG: hypothetical protein GX495_21445 [Chloroflexi bacterium]|jgi:hypothetical protein|nr:hypothetical protein [Chloroflexota bacterium]
MADGLEDHTHTLTLEDMCLRRDEERSCSIVTAFIWKCDCGYKATEFTAAGIELLKSGVPEDELTKPLVGD